MKTTNDDARLIEFGRQIREHRKSLRISIRKLAEDSGVSPSYVSAIECGKNPATGRPPEPSMSVVERLTKALGNPNTVFNSKTSVHSSVCGSKCDQNHSLIYRLDDNRGDLASILNNAFGNQVDQWVCIEDPRQSLSSDENFISWQWPFGEFPYPDNFLVVERIEEALEDEIERIASQITKQNYGVVIADCSAVMRWMVNPDAEVEYEDRWIERSTEIFKRLIGRAPIVNACVYSHRDLEALSNNIDVLNIILNLFSAHSHNITVDHSGKVLSGEAAVSAVLAESRPDGVSSGAWRQMSHATASFYSSRL